jgi:hypothetical protein
MNEFLSYIFGYGLPVSATIVAMVLVILSIGVAMSSMRYLVLGYILIVLLVPQATNYGSVDGSSSVTAYFWVKGTKSFFFSFLDMVVFITWFFGLVIGSKLSSKNRSYSSPLTFWYVAFGILFFGQVAIAAFDKSPVILEFAQMGVINVIWQGIFVSLLFATIRNERDLKVLLTIVLCCIASRELWGLFRYVFMGGDPINVYANVEFANLKLTFFDINDHILASVMLGITSWKILADREVGRTKLIYVIFLIMALLIPALSARRTAQGGLILAVLLLFFLLPRGRRTPILLLLAFIVPVSFATLALRSADTNKSASEKLLIGVKSENNSDPKKSRFYELETAWKTIKEQPVFGVGPSGQFKVTSSDGLEYHKGNYGFVHSGLGHILLKTGFIGLFIFLGIFITYINNVKKGWKEILPEHKALVVGCLCGFIAQMPNMFGGAPIIEIRTMLVSGFMFAIPLICVAIGKGKLGKNNKSGVDHELN